MKLHWWSQENDFNSSLAKRAKMAHAALRGYTADDVRWLAAMVLSDVPADGVPDLMLQARCVRALANGDDTSAAHASLAQCRQRGVLPRAEQEIEQTARAGQWYAQLIQEGPLWAHPDDMAKLVLCGVIAATGVTGKKLREVWAMAALSIASAYANKPWAMSYDRETWGKRARVAREYLESVRYETE